MILRYLGVVPGFCIEFCTLNQTNFDLIPFRDIDPPSYAPKRPLLLLDSFLLPRQMPLQNFFEHTLPILFNDIPMARYDPIKVPPLNLPHALGEIIPIGRTSHVPYKPLLPRRLPHRILKPREKPRRQPVRRLLRSPRILLVRRQVKDQVRLDERLVRPMAEHKLLVGVAGYVLVVELAVELVADL